MVKVSNWFGSEPTEAYFEAANNAQKSQPCDSFFDADCLFTQLFAWWLEFKITTQLIYMVTLAVVTIFTVSLVVRFICRRVRSRHTAPANLIIHNNVGSNTVNATGQAAAGLSPAVPPLVQPIAPVPAQPVPVVQQAATAIATSQAAAISIPLNIPPPEKYNKSKNIGTYLSELDTFFKLTKFSGNKAEALLYFLGEEMKQKLKGRRFTGSDDQQYQQMVRLINDCYKPIEKPSSVWRDEFRKITQERGERITMFHLRLTEAAMKAYPPGEFTDHTREAFINEQFLRHLRDKAINKQFQMQYSNYTTDQMLEYFRRNEAVDAIIQDNSLPNSNSVSEKLFQLDIQDQYPRQNSILAKHTNDKHVNFGDSSCRYCGKDGHQEFECNKRQHDERNAGILVPASKALSTSSNNSRQQRQ